SVQAAERRGKQEVRSIGALEMYTEDLTPMGLVGNLLVREPASPHRGCLPTGVFSRIRSPHLRKGTRMALEHPQCAWWRSPVWLALALIALSGGTAEASLVMSDPDPDPEEVVTFAKHVAPILQENCQV